jgi:Ca-activated chloride channel homolog
MRLNLCLMALVLVAVPVSSQAQILVPEHNQRRPRHAPIRRWQRPPVWSAYKIGAVDVTADVHDQAAKVRMSQVFENTGEDTIETQFLFPIPEDAAISDLTLLYDGKELPGRLLDKDNARHIYEEIVRRQRDPALLEYMGHGLFQTSVFPIPPHAKRTVEIRYSQLLHKNSGLIDFLLPIGTFKHTDHPIERLTVAFKIETTDPIKTIYSPTHSVSIERPDEHHANCKVTLDRVQSPDDLRILCGTHAGAVGMSVVSYRPKENEDGYFMLLASPEFKAAASQTVPKTVVIVVDRSGSMSGPKIEQAREAVKLLVQQLRPTDTFNIIAYDSDVDVFRAELQRVTPDTVNAALSFANGINPGGATNIDAALSLALKMLVDPKRPNYVLFLTDGQPTVGEQDELKIAANAKAADKVHARIFNLGIGYDVNARLLDRLSHDLGGQSVYVRPNENIEAYVSTLSKSIAAPVLTDIDVKFEFDASQAADAPPVSRTYPRRLTDLFAGEQLVWVGRYRKTGPVKVILTGLLGDKHQSFEFKADLTDRSVGDANGYVAKVWATRRIGELIDEIDLHGQNSELVSELVDLSKKYGIMTPFTSFLADERVNIAERDAISAQTSKSLDTLSGESAGKRAVAQRRFKGNLQAASRPPAPTWTGSDITDSQQQRFGGRGEASDKDYDGAPAGRGMGGGGMGGGGAMSNNNDAETNAAPASTNRSRRTRPTPMLDEGFIRKDSQDLKKSPESTAPKNPVQTIGDKTFYWKNNRWRDSDVTPEGEKHPIKIKAFSSQYFALAAKADSQFAKYLSLEGPILIVLDGKTYLIEPSKEADE